MKIGFIGLGIMGRPMVKNLLDAGMEVLVSDLNKDAVAEILAYGKEKEVNVKEASYQEIGSGCEMIITMVPNGSIVKSILFDEGGVAASIPEGALVCDMSSILPEESRECHDRLAEIGVSFLDAPVSGGEPGAIAGTLAIMVGGEEEAFGKMKPVFDILGSSAVYIGPSGSGSVTKLVNQLIVNNNIAIIGEGLVFAQKAGVDPEKVYQAIRGGLAGSACLDAKAPMMIERNFKPGGPIRINYKDIKNVVSAAHSMEVPIPYTAQLFEIMQYLKIHGHMQDDHSVLVRYFEALADVEVGK